MSLAVADALGGAEIICADSRQVYRGMDIGTAKVDRSSRERIPHHGLDLVDPDEAFTVADYARRAGQALDRIARAGRIAILVGGSGLYLRAVARGLPVASTGRDPEVRTVLERRLAGEGLQVLVAELRSRAPGVASRTDLVNPRRVIRALERATIHGDIAPPAPAGYPAPSVWIGLRAEPSTHRTWIEERARAQFAGGLLDEAESLLRRYPPDLPALSAIGYQEAFAVLAGRQTVAEAASATAQRTRVYARRQRTWFRREPDVTWLDAAQASTVGRAVELARLAVATDPV
jgi:tRNA dimethylallyltransferase